MGVAFVTGMQATIRILPRDRDTEHFAVHSGPEPTRHMADVDVTNTTDGHVSAGVSRGRYGGQSRSVMCAYNAIKGQPACASQFLLEINCETLGISGYVVSDCGAVIDLQWPSLPATQAQASGNLAHARHGQRMRRLFREGA